MPRKTSKELRVFIFLIIIIVISFFAPGSAFSLFVIFGGYIGYLIGKDFWFSRGRSSGCVDALIDIQRLPKDEKKFLLSIAKRIDEAQSKDELRKVESDFYDKFPPMADFVWDMESDPKHREATYILIKYRKIIGLLLQKLIK